MTPREEIVALARGFIGTPYHPRGRLPGVGMDCAGVVICAARAAGLVVADFDVPEYLPTPDGHTMLQWCDRYGMTPVGKAEMRPGDAIVFITDTLPQHIAILGDYLYGGLSIIHAANNAQPPRVIETRLMFSRRLRFVAAYALPGIA